MWLLKAVLDATQSHSPDCYKLPCLIMFSGDSTRIKGNGKETRNATDISWKALSHRSAWNQLVMSLTYWGDEGAPVPAQEPESVLHPSTGMGSWNGLSAHISSLHCSPSTVLRCEAYAFCEIKWILESDHSERKQHKPKHSLNSTLRKYPPH